MELGDKVKELRERAGLTQEELAGEMGVQRNTVWRWENKKANLKADNIQRLASVLNIDASELVASAEEVKISEPLTLREQTIVFPSMAYWGKVADNARIVAANGDLGEIFSVKALLKRAFDILSLGENQLQAETALREEAKKSAPFVQVGGGTKNSYSRINIGEVPNSALAGATA